MRVRVIQRFMDRITGGYHDPDDVLRVTKDRGKELVAAGVAMAIKSRKRKKPSEDKARRPSEDKSEGASS